MMRVIEQEQGHYEVREVPYGKAYSWHPGQVRVECDCGKVLAWEGPGTACGCGKTLEYPEFQESCDHPWLEDYEEWREEKEANGLKCEYYAFVGVNDGS